MELLNDQEIWNAKYLSPAERSKLILSEVRKLQDREIAQAQPEKENNLQRIDRFHEHLDVCPQCKKHPFDLCHTGEVLLKYAVTGVCDDDSVLDK